VSHSLKIVNLKKINILEILRMNFTSEIDLREIEREKKERTYEYVGSVLKRLHAPLNVMYKLLIICIDLFFVALDSAELY